MLLLFCFVGCTFYFVLLKRHLTAVFHSILSSVHILPFIYFSFVYFSFVYFSFVRSSHRKCSIKFFNIHRKTTVLESLFDKVASLKWNYNTRVFLWILQNFQEFSICKWLLLTLLHFIHAISNDSGVVTKLPETFSLFLLKSKYRLTLTQGFYENGNFLYNFQV